MPLTASRPSLPGALAPALALLLGVASSGAHALGLGQPQVHSPLGKPLDVSIPLSLADGERLTDACMRAEVMAGDARVPAGLLQLRVEGDPGQLRLRLQSLARIDEPALRITLALGCPLRLTREFNAFVDPPGSGTAVAPPPPPAPPLVAAVPAPAGVPVAQPPVVAQAAPAAAKPARPRAKSPQPRASGPRLVMDRPEVLVSKAPKPAAQAAPAADNELTPELEAQITALENTVAQLRAELEARQAQAASAAQAASVPPPPPVTASAPVPVPEPIPTVVRPVTRASPYRDPMTWLLALGLGLIAGAAAFYGSRWVDERRRRERAYWRALHSAEGGRRQPAPPPVPGMAPAVAGAAAALPDEGQHTITSPQPKPMTWPPVAEAQAPASPEVDLEVEAPDSTPSHMLRTQPMPACPEIAPVLSEALPSDLTIADELLDLQQQVDFLQLLGQHDAAADLLNAWLARGQAGAMPYLLAMELCQQRSEAERFAELAGQAEQRFGIVAPSWSQSLARGRSLDGCASVIPHLQVVWADPVAVMTMLRELLARGGGPGVAHFELPAYRDLLLLYSVARDLYEAGLRGSDVDLMLPMD